MNCDIQDADYILYQRGYNDTTINPGWTSADQYDATLVSFTVDASGIKLTMLTSAMNDVLTYHNDAKCDLQLITTLECTQIFDIYAKSYHGFLAKVAEVTVTIQSECLEV